MTPPSPLTALAAAICALALAGPASASLVTMQTRHATDTAPSLGSDALNGEYYRATVQALLADAPTAGTCDAVVASFTGLSNQSVCGGGASDLAFHFAVDFGLSGHEGHDFGVRIGPDFGRGGAVFLDGQLLGVRTQDMWWNGAYTQPGQYFEFDALGLLAGMHRLDVFGLEACCDGTQQAQFRLASGAAWKTFGDRDGLKAGAVPEPGALALALLALAAAAGIGRGNVPA
ncbi:CCXG family PEP-CTERM protein, partial [Ideonella sp. A 288]|uniref:CCXG family PEP-CTERM protein n=1 Tax=Ideonella sp. A 288 TaxID=1962181 RepID=UPI000B4C18B6